MNYDKIKESVEFGIKNIKKEHYENYFYNAYDKNKLKAKIENLNNRLHKKPKIYKDYFLSQLVRVVRFISLTCKCLI